LAVAEANDVDVEVIQYLKTPPDRATLEGIVAVLEDPVEDLVRKDGNFSKLGLDAGDYTERPSVVELLLEHPELMQRPVLVKGGRAIIGRPKDRVEPFLVG
jgi:arsenate reductase (glutaredoxin)